MWRFVRHPFSGAFWRSWFTWKLSHQPATDISISDVEPKLFGVLVLSDGSLTAIFFRTLCGLPQELRSSLHWAVQVEQRLEIAENYPPKNLRFRDNTASFNASSKRYVITNPPGNESFLNWFFPRSNIFSGYCTIFPAGTFKLLATDQVMVCHQTKAQQLSRTNQHWLKNFLLTKLNLFWMNLSLLI